MKNKFLKGLIASFALAANGLANAGLINLNEQQNFSDFSASTSTRSAIGNGIYDGFDGSYRVQGNFANISQSRTVTTLNDIYSYSIYDLFTNNTGQAWSGTIRYLTDLGSDGATTNTFEDDYRYITDETFFGGDEAIAFTFGNNSWTVNNTNAYGHQYGSFIENDVNPRAVNIDFTVSLDVGESIALLNYATLALDDTDRSTDFEQAKNLSTQLLNAPRYDGLSQSQINHIANWEVRDVPEPSTLAIFALGIMGLASRRFKKQS
jgi:hypothetical protein